MKRSESNNFLDPNGVLFWIVVADRFLSRNTYERTPSLHIDFLTGWLSLEEYQKALSGLGLDVESCVRGELSSSQNILNRCAVYLRSCLGRWDCLESAQKTHLLQRMMNLISEINAVDSLSTHKTPFHRSVLLPLLRSAANKDHDTISPLKVYAYSLYHTDQSLYRALLGEALPYLVAHFSRHCLLFHPQSQYIFYKEAEQSTRVEMHAHTCAVATDKYDKSTKEFSEKGELFEEIEKHFILLEDLRCAHAKYKSQADDYIRRVSKLAQIAEFFFGFPPLMDFFVHNPGTVRLCALYEKDLTSNWLNQSRYGQALSAVVQGLLSTCQRIKVWDGQSCAPGQRDSDFLEMSVPVEDGPYLSPAVQGLVVDLTGSRSPVMVRRINTSSVPWDGDSAPPEEGSQSLGDVIAALERNAPADDFPPEDKTPPGIQHRRLG